MTIHIRFATLVAIKVRFSMICSHPAEDLVLQTNIFSFRLYEFMKLATHIFTNSYWLASFLCKMIGTSFNHSP